MENNFSFFDSISQFFRTHHMEKAMLLLNSGGIALSSSSSSSALLIVIASSILMLILLIILILIACKFRPWRYFRSSPATVRHRARPQVDDIERPLVSGDPDVSENQSNESAINYSAEGAGRQGGFNSPHSMTVPPKRILATSPQLIHSDTLVVDIANNLEDSLLGQTLKRPFPENQFAEEQTQEKREDTNSKYGAGSILMLEVIAGPSRGLHYSVQSTNTSKLPVTIGRVSPSDILLIDSEVSGKHAMINWNMNTLKWELVDMGSTNGTLLNSQTVHHQSGSRQWGLPVALSSADIITLGTTSKIFVQITADTVYQIPFGFGIASDPMSLRRGGKKLPMEDVVYYQWPVAGTNEFGLFGICDGHGGADAATSVSKIMPEVIAGILSDSFRREKVLLEHDASDVLREAFNQTEAHINHYYEGCTATVILVWADGRENFTMQCANVGDSACIVNIEGKQMKMTEDHRIVSNSERARFQALGTPLRDGETRICGINLARMIGDKFLKEQDARFSSEPYISEVVHIPQGSKCFALLASDGFWDVVSIKKAVQLVHQTMEGHMPDRNSSAEKIANILLSEARTLRTKDNTSVIFLDFNTSNKIYSSEHDP